MSKIEEKLEHFASDIMSDVGEERRQIIEAVDNELRAELEAKEMTFLGNAYELIQDALTSIDKEKNEQLSKSIMGNKVELLKKRNALIDEMFDEAIKALRAFTKSDEYVPHVLSLVEDAKEFLGDGEIEVCLNAADKDLISEIENKSGLKVTLESKKKLI